MSKHQITSSHKERSPYNSKADRAWLNDIDIDLYLHSHQHASILIPAQQRILSIPRIRIFNVSPAVHELLVARDLRQLPSNSTIHILDDIEVCREEDIEVALVDLQRKKLAMLKIHIERNVHIQKGSTPGPSAVDTESARPVR